MGCLGQEVTHILEDSKIVKMVKMITAISGGVSVVADLDRFESMVKIDTILKRDEWRRWFS